MARQVLIFLFAFVVFLSADIVAQYRNRAPVDAGRRFSMPKENPNVPIPNTKAPSTNQGILLLDDKGSALRLTISGAGHTRMVSDVNKPFPLGWESSVTFKAQPNRAFSFDFRLDMLQPSVSDRYGSGATVIPNVAATWISDVRDREIYQMVTRVGDLRRMTFGKGLFYKDMNEQGGVMQWVGRTQQFSIAYVLNGVVSSSDIVLLDWSNSDRTLGLGASWTLLDDRPGQALDSRLSGYGRLNVFNWIDLDWELGISNSSAADTLGYSVLVAPSKEIKMPNFYWFSGVTYRGYFGSVMAPYRQLHSDGRPLADVRTSLFDEELDVDSWRSAVILSEYSEQIQSLAVRIKSEFLLVGNTWVYGEYEGISIVPDSGKLVTRQFGAGGLKFAFSQNHFGYLGIQSKFIASLGTVNGADDTLLVNQGNPSMVAGVKFKF
ncbi:hypothetical protein EBR57_02645 [bacterium]|nr:hypothetical protein [bacterium]